MVSTDDYRDFMRDYVIPRLDKDHTLPYGRFRSLVIGKWGSDHRTYRKHERMLVMFDFIEDRKAYIYVPAPVFKALGGVDLCP